MARVIRRRIAAYGRVCVTVETSPQRFLTFFQLADFHRFQAGYLPKGYRPTVGQRRYSRAELRRELVVLRGGKER